ncbi:hypothetical protein [Paenibacillus whitsoniae]|uniref:Uncharacterized protein n=1 Tax=Paenibacillus whitsoniae TaxID=2496558 RepID=A0A3S0A1R4_9BACL|nr:hypothetical protein [Paenibacillus whitsoniae]RTE06833.1 hypothetical protein EJQ19_22255 [Paenibacillus whitsoniae]
MSKQKRLQIYLEKSLWCLPVIILILGAVSVVKESIWWTLIGFFLFAGILVISIRAWFGMGREVELEQEELEADEERADLETTLLRQYY